MNEWNGCNRKARFDLGAFQELARLADKGGFAKLHGKCTYPNGSVLNGGIERIEPFKTEGVGVGLLKNGNPVWLGKIINRAVTV